ncbi:nicotinamidase-related amidase [Comamonas odontotermitis]|uniref:Nicotinamidase-related amidase n=1 Tax=Comamonas odontotermitis TaxID=379895 RepID=A0ABR6RGI0_9BURK|nr:isochorismatase family cysteine hydrolase [Comamonas odontotermitis]MBB6578265.1 nicotinamidase-related amidase [Comamonas odontotermitis]
MQFEPWIVERVKARQGVLHPYDTLDAATTAFVVVDLQKYYTQPGFQGECAPARGIFDNVNKLAAAMRAHGGKVVWIKTNADGADQFWSHHHRHMLTPERSARRLLELSASHEGFEMPDTLDVQESDLIVVKRCYSALAPGASELDAVLKAHGIRTVLIGGTVTNVCCESTARDAMMLDYATIMVDDALAAVTPYEHEHSLNNWMLFFGDVLTVDEVVERLR